MNEILRYYHPDPKTLSSALIAAAKHNRTRIVHILLQHGANANSISAFGDSILHTISRFGYFEITQLLIDYGANVNARGHFQMTALHVALSPYNSDLVKLLVQSGADVTAVMEDGRTTLHLAVACWNITISTFVNDAVVNARDHNGTTPLHMAVKYGSIDTVRHLVQSGANLDAVDDIDQSTPLHLAAENGRDEVVHILLNQGARTNIVDRHGRTLLHMAALRGYACLVEPLLASEGIEIDSVDANGHTALYMAWYGGHLLMAETLLERGASKRGIRRTWSGLIQSVNNLSLPTITVKRKQYSPSRVSRFGHNPDVFELLLSGEVTLDAINSQGRISLHMAAWQGAVHVVKLLLDVGADINECSRHGKTALSLAIKFNHDNITQLLSKQGE